MKKTILAAVLLLASFSALAQQDPKDSSPVVVFAAQATTATSSPYAINLSAAGETVWLVFSGGTGSYLVEGSIDTEAAVKAGTAVWVPIISGSSFPAGPWISDPMPYLRVTVTRTGGTFRVLMRGAGGTSFRKVE